MTEEYYEYEMSDEDKAAAGPPEVTSVKFPDLFRRLADKLDESEAAGMTPEDVWRSAGDALGPAALGAKDALDALTYDLSLFKGEEPPRPT